MSENSDRYATVAAGFEARLGGVSADGWSAPSPCTDWTARDVVVHVIETQRRVRSALGDAPFEALAPDADLAAAWAAARASVQQAVGDPEKAAKVVTGMFGEQPFGSLVGGVLCLDTIVHTWDLARATGQDERLDPAAAEQALAFLTPADEAIRRPGGFAAKIEPPAGADVQTRLLSFCGRAV